jgi:hypothetical protein
MAKLAEQFVEEWLNRRGYFTIRGIKVGVNEIDLLAIKPEANGFEAKHIEVQVSFRPVSYISKLTDEQRRNLGLKSKNSAAKRSVDVLKSGIREWTDKKYFSKKKTEMRDRVLRGTKWHFMLVHGVVKEPKELEFIKAEGVELIPFQKVLKELRFDKNGFSGEAGTDIAEMIQYFSGHTE